MNTSPLLSCLSAQNGLVCFVAPLLLSTLVLFGIVSPNIAYANPSDLVGLTVHNDKSGQTNYITLTRKGDNGDPKDHVFCQPIPPLDWVDVQSLSGIAMQAMPGQTMWLRYFHSPKCNPSSIFMSVNLPIPPSPVYNHCWFNPDNTNAPNWSGCVSPSQTLTILTIDLTSIEI
jgi:hypothetical protein